MTQGREVKPHIGVFGRCNVGKSSLINALSGQNVAIVSEVAGTTTDSVKKTMEIKGIGAVVLIDTAGIDDVSILGDKRVKKALEVLAQIDLAVLVISEDKFAQPEEDIIKQCAHFSIPYIVVANKSDICPLSPLVKANIEQKYPANVLSISANNKADIASLTDKIRNTIPPTAYQKKGMLDDIIKPQSVVLLVTPIDSSAPEGRMILPQVQMIRDVLDNDSINIVVKETELEYVLNNVYSKPDLVITDSQAFDYVAKIVTEDIPLTSFSIVLAKLKGSFEAYIEGTPFIDRLQDGDRVLMLESCSHQPTCEDIGRVKLPAWIRKYTNKRLDFDAVAGLGDIGTITDYAMVIQCGGCMVTNKQLASRLLSAVEAGIPVSNYGFAIAYINGIFNRATAIFRTNK
ncbi:MAG: [FeFe] hydrogenase H-cluster maturation GTPase HydF [Bacteroidales bacterium]|jgi:[FeFe] hydrogenase H-cluster maturation GTPase HydF|nr:[FeFe] hydrogenase H-cluster maturation GTPase HydF [Bacteroidales bacterium]